MANVLSARVKVGRVDLSDPRSSVSLQTIVFACTIHRRRRHSNVSPKSKWRRSVGQSSTPLSRRIEAVSRIPLGPTAVRSSKECRAARNAPLSSVYLVRLNEDNERSSIQPLHLQPQANSFSIFSLQYSADGSEIICGSNDRFVYIYDLQQGRRILRVRN